MFVTFVQFVLRGQLWLFSFMEAARAVVEECINLSTLLHLLCSGLGYPAHYYMPHLLSRPCTCFPPEWCLAVDMPHFPTSQAPLCVTWILCSASVSPITGFALPEIRSGEPLPLPLTWYTQLAPSLTSNIGLLSPHFLDLLLSVVSYLSPLSPYTLPFSF